MSLALVARITEITPHPNADRVEVIRIMQPGFGAHLDSTDVQLVVGKHYRVGDLGVWLRPGALIPGWLAQDLWLVGKNRANEPFTVREIEIRGVPSPGLWCGQWYRNDNTKESAMRAANLANGGGLVVDGWVAWPRWVYGWEPGDMVDNYLEVVPA